jgi:folate-dependent phosphoribosylglycinamide formyltransferase PurN
MPFHNSIPALLLASPSPMSIGPIARWLEVGHRVTSIWYPERARGGRSFAADARLAREMPFLSMHGLSAAFELNCRPVPRMASHPELIDEARAEGAQVVLSIMFMDRIPQAMTSAFPGRVLNLHPSVLPAYRGPNPVLGMLWDQRIEQHSGVTLHQVTEGLDEGPVIARQSVEFPASRNMGIYMGMMIDAAGGLLREVVPRYLDGELQPETQDPNAGNWSAMKSSRLAILRSFPLERVRWICSTIGQFSEFHIEGTPVHVRINRVAEVLGPPTGAPDSLTDRFAEVDIADARVRLSRSRIMRQTEIS